MAMSEEERRTRLRKYGRKYRAANSIKLKEVARKYRAANLEKIREYGRKYRSSNPEEIKDRARKRHALAPEKRREWSRKYYAAHREKYKEQSLKWRKANPEKFRACNRRWADANPKKVEKYRRKFLDANPRLTLVRYAKSRAKKYGLAFDLDVDKMHWPEFCPVLGIKLKYEPDRDGLKSRNRATLDRIVPELGYTLANTRVMSWEANRMKNNYTVKTLQAILDYIKRETEAPTSRGVPASTLGSMFPRRSSIHSHKSAPTAHTPSQHNEDPGKQQVLPNQPKPLQPRSKPKERLDTSSSGNPPWTPTRTRPRICGLRVCVPLITYNMTITRGLRASINMLGRWDVKRDVYYLVK